MTTDTKDTGNCKVDACPGTVIGDGPYCPDCDRAMLAVEMIIDASEGLAR